MARVLNDMESLGKEIERLKKRIHSLNGSISLRANKIGNTNILNVIAREEKMLQDQINRKKQAIEDLEALKKKMGDLRRLKRK